jgi:hypothetical protein
MGSHDSNTEVTQKLIENHEIAHANFSPYFAFLFRIHARHVEFLA